MNLFHTTLGTTALKGEMAENPETLMMHEIETGKDYALLISTCAGAWRYLIGDTIRLENRELSEILFGGIPGVFLTLVLPQCIR